VLTNALRHAGSTAIRAECHQTTCTHRRKVLHTTVYMPQRLYSASASVINDLLLVKSKLADVSVLSSTDVEFIIDTLCVS